MAQQARRPLAARRQRRVRALDGARRDRRLAARHGVRLRDARRGRHLLRADGDPEGRPPDRRGHEGRLGQAEAQARHLRRRRLRGHAHPGGERPSTAPARAPHFGHPAAGKTGTTEEHADAWFCGYTPRLGTTVWVGYPKGKIPMENVHGISVAGGTFPAQIWRLFMSAAIGGLEPVSFAEPSDWPEWTDFERGQYGPLVRLRYDDDDYYAPPASTTGRRARRTRTTDADEPRRSRRRRPSR